MKMKKADLALLFIIAWQSISCLNAPRDNIYDPGNPDKSSVCGHLYEPDSATLEGAIVDLTWNDSIVQTDTSNAAGFFMFEDIDPAIYTIMAKAKHYEQIVIEAESIWAGTDVNDLKMVFSTLYFEDDEEYATDPHGFQVVCGNWQVRHDDENPDAHSAPHVYAAICDSQSNTALTLFRSRLKDYDFHMKFKVPASPDTSWRAGMVVGYQNIYNFYVLEITPVEMNLINVADSVSTPIRTRSANLAVNTWHSMESRHIIGLMAFYHNGEYVFSITDYSYSEAGIGLWAINSQAGSTSMSAFDDVTIHQR